MMLCAWLETDNWTWRPLFAKDKAFNYRQVDARWLCFGVQYSWHPFRLELIEVAGRPDPARNEASGETTKNT